MKSDTSLTETANEPVEIDLVVINRMGIHARPATRIVETAKSFNSALTLEKDGEIIDAKSIFGVMTLAAIQGSIIRARAVGDDAARALDALKTLFEEGFGELDPPAEESTGE